MKKNNLVLEVLIKLRRTHFYQKYSVYIIGLIIGLLIYSMIKDVDDSILNIGVPPQMGIKGIFFSLFLLYWGVELEIKITSAVGFAVLVPFLGFLGWSFFYDYYREDRYNEIMKEKM